MAKHLITLRQGCKQPSSSQYSARCVIINLVKSRICKIRGANAHVVLKFGSPPTKLHTFENNTLISHIKLFEGSYDKTPLLEILRKRILIAVALDQMDAMDKNQITNNENYSTGLTWLDVPLSATAKWDIGPM